MKNSLKKPGAFCFIALALMLIAVILLPITWNPRISLGIGIGAVVCMFIDLVIHPFYNDDDPISF